MIRSLVSILCIAALSACCLQLAPAAEKAAAPSAVIVSPKEAAKVGQVEELEGKVTGEGWPVVLVQPQADERMWWIQAPVEEMDGGKFTVPIQCGNDQTKPGTKFKLMIVLAKSKEDAHKFERGKTRPALPAGLTRSEPVTVTRGE